MSISDAGLRRLTWAIAGVYVLGAAVGISLDRAAHYKGDYFFAVIVLAFPVVGFVVLQKRPRNTLGWLMLAMGLPAALPFQDYAEYALVKGLPGASVGLALSEPTWVPFIGISGFLLLLFPDGHLPTPRWRWFGWLCGIGLVVLSLVVLFGSGTFGDIGHPEIQNPWGLHVLDLLGGWIYVTTIVAPLVVVGGAVAVFRRLRRATDPVERQQLRWLAWAAVLIAGAYVLAFIPELIFGSEQSNWNDVFATLAVASFVLIPITIGIAILRYRLYDIDVVIRKTVVFAVLAVFIAVVYVGIVAGISVFVSTLSSTVASAIAAAVVALAIQPVRGWAQRTADRVVYGKRATPYEVLTEFGENLAETYGADDVLDRLARVLGEGVGAERARVWLGTDGTRRVVAAWPEDAAGDDDLIEPVRHQGEVLGALSVTMPANDQIDEPRTELVTGLAAQAGLVLRNVGLVEDLRESRRRLVAAQDVERRKLERNIHDGAQQQLVALTVKLRLARSVLEKDPARVDGMLEQLADETQRALEDLRDLARGIYPPLLADKGLGAALDAQARRSPVPVIVEADGVGRFAPEVEAAVYFSCLEAMQNVAKYAAASAATVSLREAPDRLEFRVHDDGVGFDAGATSYGTGLQGIADRLAALGGTLAVSSAPGNGTAITGSLPALPADAKVSPDEALPAVPTEPMGAARP
ncbi:MAG: histidine kinase [Actinomycetota bacterium]